MRNINNKTILITGGSGFIGHNFIKLLLKKKIKNLKIINIDKLTNASIKKSNLVFKNFKNYKFYKFDISNKKKIDELFHKFKIDIIINFAAESHVDNSIKESSKFIKSNIIGTYNLINAAYKNWMQSPHKYKDLYKKSFFLQISTDEVYGSIKMGKNIDETGKFYPSSPYSASKAAAEDIVHSFYKTYGLNTLISNSSNNFGPNQNIEKFIPKVIYSILNNKKIILYGNGKNIRDWIYVDDNCNALIYILKKGKFGESYNISTNFQFSNKEIILKIISLISKKINKKQKYLKSQIKKTNDRHGHDFRYGINSKKLKKLGWTYKNSLNDGLEKTIDWYIKNYD